VLVVTEADRGYLFGISCDGQYSLRKWDGKAGDKGVMTVLVNWTASPSIQAGSNKTNTIGFMAVGDRLILYANGAYALMVPCSKKSRTVPTDQAVLAYSLGHVKPRISPFRLMRSTTGKIRLHKFKRDL